MILHQIVNDNSVKLRGGEEEDLFEQPIVFRYFDIVIDVHFKCGFLR